MNKIFFTLITTVVVLTFFFVLTADKTQAPAIVPNKMDTEDVFQSPYGYAFTYKKGTDGYTVITPEDEISGDLVFTQSIFSTQDYVLLTENTIPHEAPVGLTIEVYRNPMNIEVEEWIKINEDSNYQYSPTGDITLLQLGKTSYFTYQWDGLYKADVYVYSQEGYIYVFSNMWMDAKSSVRVDLQNVIKSIQWSTSTISAQVAHGDIFVTLPLTGQEIKSPLAIEGQARGFWYFEASFPVMLTNWDGLIIAQGIATAQEEWMTEDFVPFKAELTFTKPEYGERGSLILKKDNPSGLPEHDDAIEVPIVFE